MTCTQGTDMNSRCISLSDPTESYDEYKGYKRINELLQIAFDAIQHANHEAENLPPSSDGFKRKFAIYAEDDIDEYHDRTRSKNFQAEVKKRGYYTYAAKLFELDDGDVSDDEAPLPEPAYRPAFSPVQLETFVEGQSYTPDHTPPTSPQERCYSPYNPDAE